jgi:autotransporter-associated beta strand protein
MLTRITLDLVCALAVVLGLAAPVTAVNVGVNVNNTIITMPQNGIGLHTSVYSNLDYASTTLASRIVESGVDVLRGPGGSYSDMYQWSTHSSNAGAYCASGTNFANFVRLMNNSGTNGMITIDYGDPSKAQDLSSPNVVGGQPKEAAAWVAYANASASIYNTPNDVTLGTDAQGTNWYTAGYWARLRSSTVTQYRVWSQAAGTYNSAYEFLAMNRPNPVGIKYWEIGNEVGGNGYTGTQWEFDAHAPYNGGNTSDNTGRKNNPLLSPTAYATNLVQFSALMKAVDPTIKIGAGLDGASTTSNRNILTTAGSSIDFGIVHWYVNNGTDSGTEDANLLNAVHSQLPSQYSGVMSDINNYAGHSLEVHMTEFGYFGNVTTPAVTGLFAADSYLTGFEQGFNSLYWLELNKTSFLGDTSALTRGPAFYAIEAVSKLAEGGDKMVGTTSNSSNVKTHAALQDDGTVAVMLINENSSSASVNVSISGLLNGIASNSGLLYATNLTSSFTTTNITSGVGTSFSVSLPGRNIYTYLLNPVHAYTSWTATNGGSWRTATNWNGSLIPNIVFDTATFGDSINGSSATVNLDGDNTVATLTFNNNLGGSYSISPGTSVPTSKLIMNNLASTATITCSTGNNTIAAPVELRSNLTINSATGAGLNISSPISESGGTKTLTKTGEGTLVLSGANTYTGITTVSAGALQLSGGSNRLSTSGAFSITGGVLDLDANSQTTSGAVSLQGGTVQNGTITKSGAAYDGQAGMVSAVLAGGVGLTKTTTNTLTLNGANTYTGATQINGGVLELVATGQILTDSEISTADTATFQINGGSHTVGNISGTGTTNVIAGELTATSIVQNTLTLGIGARVTIAPLPGGPLAANDSLSPVPEPSTLTLLGIGAMVLFAFTRQRRRR